MCGDEVGDLVNEIGGVDGDETVGRHEVQRAHDAQKQTRCDDCRDDGNEDVTEQLNGAHENVLLLCDGLLGLGLAGGLKATLGEELLIDLVNRTRAENDLQLSLGLKDALDPLDVLKRLLIDLLVIGDDKTQARGAMRCGHHVLGTTRQGKHLSRHVFVVHEIPFPSSQRTRYLTAQTVIVFSLYVIDFSLFMANGMGISANGS